jgi:lysine biosynthesis protein LysW
MAFAYCPDCAARIHVGRKPKLGQLAVCHCCDADLEIVHLNPLELDWADEITDGDWKEDWELELERA